MTEYSIPLKLSYLELYAIFVRIFSKQSSLLCPNITVGCLSNFL